MATVRQIRGKWYLDYRDARSRRHRELAGDGRSKRKAERLLRKKLDQIDHGISGESRQKLAEYAQRWLERKRLSVKPGTWDEYQGKLAHYVLDAQFGLGDVPLYRLSKPLIEDWLLAVRGKWPKLSASTLNAALTVLGGVMESACADGLLEVNPTRRVQRLPVPMPQVDWLSPAEIRDLLAGAHQVDEQLELMIRLAVMTGIRRGELLALRWLDLDLTGRRLFIRRSYRAGTFGDPKSRRSRRPVELPPGLCRRLAERRQAEGDPAGDALVFHHRSGEAWEPSLVSGRLWHRALVAAGLRESLRWHDLRHTFASLLLDQGESVKLVQDQLGHSSSQVTLDVYVHLQRGVGAAAADRLERSIEIEAEIPDRNEDNV